MARRPNIVLINCDDLGYGDLGCYGSTRNATPALDRMAAEGARFDSFLMASPVCSPSRGALLTGCYPPRIGFGSFDGMPVLFPGQPIGLSPDEATLPALLRDAGYRTMLIGKWHCGDQPELLPTRRGFEHWFGLPYSNDMGRQVADPAWGGFAPDYPPLPLVRDDEVIEQQPEQGGLTERFVTEAVEFIRSCGDQPFFLYLAHLYVHVPIYVQERFARASQNGPYGAAVACIDWAAEVLLHELRARGLDEDTLVIFTSDNGSRANDEGGSNEPLRGEKGTTWEGGQRVPFIARWPGRITPGSTSDELLTALDLLPTLAGLAGAEVPTDRTIDGLDAADCLLDGAASPRDAFAHYWMDHLEAVRDPRWKLHVARHRYDWSVDEVLELYDLDADPGETTDVAAQHPDVVARLQALAERFRAELGDARLGIEGEGRRAPARVASPAPLTTFDPDHPYYAAEYDLPHRG